MECLLAKLFNIIINVVVCEWMRIMCETLDHSDGDLAAQVEALFAIFFVNQSSSRRPLTSLLRRSDVSALPRTQRRCRQWCARQERSGSNSRRILIDA